eukprot:m.139793 g.139793  ORF g.139793 m.139793 type:complete len:141 (+) comp52555_c0_seq1:355-777(+)
MSTLSVKEVFELAKSKAGGVPKDKVGLVVRSQRLCPTEKQLNAAIANAGVGDEATLDQVTKIVAALESARFKNVAETLSNAIKPFDQDGLGTVGITDLKNVLTRLGEKLDTQSLDQVFRVADVDGFGQIDYAQFAQQLSQ